MKNLFRNLFLFSIVAGLASLAHAQDGPTRAEFECLSMANSSKLAVPGEPGRSASFHHVWLPELKQGTFESNGLNLLYDMEGTGSEVVIVVHGGPGLPHEYFHPALSSLGPYVTLVYFDRRADMLSTRSLHEPVSLDEMADDIDALRQKLGLSRVTLLGHSFGGAIALTYALKHPENVKRLILVGTSAVLENPADIEKRMMKSLSPDEMAAFSSNEGRTGAGSPCDRVRNRYRALFPHYFLHKPDAVTLDRGTYMAYFDMLARKQMAADDKDRFDVRAQLGQIDVPVLILEGRYDQVTPLGYSSEMAKELPQSRLVVMEHSGHFPFTEENYLFTEWVRMFINGTKDRYDDRASTQPIITQTDGSN